MSNHSRALDSRMLLPLLLTGATAACGGEAFDQWCNTPGQHLSLLFQAVPLGIIVAAAVGWDRRRRLDGWDLRKSANSPPYGSPVWVVLVVFAGAGLALSFALYGAEDCAPEQRALNLRFTWLGVLLASCLCLLGLLAANWWYTRH